MHTFMHVQFDVYFSLASIEHVYILLALTLTLARAKGLVSLVEILSQIQFKTQDVRILKDYFSL